MPHRTPVPAWRRPLLRLDLLLVLTALLAAGLLKLQLRGAGADDLRWLLLPAVRAVETVSSFSFQTEAGVGYIDPVHLVVVGPACAGLHFLLIAFCLLVHGGLPERRTAAAKLLWLPQAAVWAWLLTLAVNTIRILSAAHLYTCDTARIGLGRGQLHRLLGIVVYFSALLLLHLWLSRRRAPEERRPVSAFIPWLWYCAGTVAVPLILRLLRRDLEGFPTHALTVVAMSALLALAAAWGLRVARRRRARGALRPAGE